MIISLTHSQWIFLWVGIVGFGLGCLLIIASGIVDSIAQWKALDDTDRL